MQQLVFDLSKFDWQAVSAIAAVLLVMLNAALIATIWFGYKNIKESALTRDATLLIWAIERMSIIKNDLKTLRNAP